MSPAIPGFTGNGLAMRAGHNLRALSHDFSIHLLVISIYDEKSNIPSDEILQYCASYKQINAHRISKRKFLKSFINWVLWSRTQLPDEWTRWNPKIEKEISAYLKELKCRRIWAFRFYLLPWLRTRINKGFKVWLDLDELESAARERLAKLHLKLGCPEISREIQIEAEMYRDLETIFLPRFERIITASNLETDHLQKNLPNVLIETWPNIIFPPALKIPPKQNNLADCRLLFIGNMEHFPNRDAIRFAVQEVLPQVQRLAPHRQVILQVIGSGAEAFRRDFADLSQIEWLGAVKDLALFYAKADIVIVPLRTGGGTRIKILEALAYQKAVVSTQIGAEGLGILHDRELLLADEPADMAAACAELLVNNEKQTRLAKAGYAYVTTHHSESILKLKASALVKAAYAH